jgi:anthranilate phosphoribosyltransferase
MKGETPDEITGAATVMREKALHIAPRSKEYLVDTCGTGGDGSNTFNISTAAAFVAAGAGAIVAKHGNRSVSSKCGSADVLEALGVNISLSPEQMKTCLDSIGICFLFAPALHKAMKYAIGPRKEIAIRTIFNILGPLTNPADAKTQLLGVFTPLLTEPMAMVLNNLGSKKAYVVCGKDNLDEISLSAETQISEVNNSKITTYSIRPEDFGFTRVAASELSGGLPPENASIIRDVLSGKKGPHRDIVLLNAAFALAASGVAADPHEGLSLAKNAIDQGNALRKLEELTKRTSEFQNETVAA